MKSIEKLKDQKIYYIQHFEENSNNIKKIWNRRNCEYKKHNISKGDPIKC